jgi:Mrp family chromosome partitioning ATPase
MKELLENLKQDYDYILIDTPPVMIVTDAAVLSSIADGTILVIASGETIIDGAVKAKERLQKVGANILGAIHNKVKINKATGYQKYYQYNYEGSDAKKKARKQRLFHKDITKNV